MTRSFKKVRNTRYMGYRLNSVHRDWDTVGFKMLLAFPDVYRNWNVVCRIQDTLQHRKFQPFMELLNVHLPLMVMERSDEGKWRSSV